MNRLICSWCQRLLREGTLPPSHGICPTCKEQVMAWDTKSIEGMETMAKGETDGSCNVQIRSHWLEVRWDGSEFKYKWGKNYVSRKDAEAVLASR